MAENSARPPRILVVDDDENIPLFLREFAQRVGCPIQFDHASDIADAVEKLNTICYDAALIDVRLPGVTGISLGGLVREHDVNLPMAYFTNMDTEEVRKEALTQHAAFLLKARYLMEGEKGLSELMGILCRLAQINPCLGGGVRVDNHGFPRRLDRTPIELPQSFCELLKYSKARAAAA